ncbi:MAG: head GIN domain-containing protein [Pseudomonadota bacterium]
MLKSILTTAAGLAALSAAAWAAEKTYDVSGFSEVSAAAGVDVVITVGERFAVVASTDEGDFEHLIVQRKGDELRVTIDRKKRRRWKSEHGFKVEIAMPALEGLSASSAADIVASGVDADDFSIDASSGADISVSGRCNEVDVDVSSGADVDARGLECRSARADASSGADAVVYASERVDAEASSGGDVTVYGGPDEIDMNTSSGGDVRIRA